MFHTRTLEMLANKAMYVYIYIYTCSNIALREFR